MTPGPGVHKMHERSLQERRLELEVKASERGEGEQRNFVTGGGRAGKARISIERR